MFFFDIVKETFVFCQYSERSYGRLPCKVTCECNFLVTNCIMLLRIMYDSDVSRQKKTCKSNLEKRSKKKPRGCSQTDFFCIDLLFGEYAMKANPWRHI